MHMAEPITYFWHKSVPYFILKIMKVYASSIYYTVWQNDVPF